MYSCIFLISIDECLYLSLSAVYKELIYGVTKISSVFLYMGQCTRFRCSSYQRAVTALDEFLQILCCEHRNSRNRGSNVYRNGGFALLILSHFS